MKKEVGTLRSADAPNTVLIRYGPAGGDHGDLGFVVINRCPIQTVVAGRHFRGKALSPSFCVRQRLQAIGYLLHLHCFGWVGLLCGELAQVGNGTKHLVPDIVIRPCPSDVTVGNWFHLRYTGMATFSSHQFACARKL
jgi:hypothetical protein